MAESPELWKQRYEFALEAAKRSEQEHRALVAQLGRALTQVSLGCEGQDKALDAELEGLRAFLRLKTLATDVLASKIDVVEERLHALAARRRGADPRVEQALDELLEALHVGPAPRELTRAVEALRKESRGGAEPAAVLAKAVTLLPQRLAAAAAAATAAMPAAATSAAAVTHAPARPGLLRRLFGGPDSARNSTPPRTVDAMPPGTPPAAGIEQAFEPLSDPASKALDALIDTVPAPAAEPALRTLYEGAKQRLARGVRWQELVPSIEEIRVLASAALARGRDEFGLFLHQLSERLAHGAAALEQAGAQAGERGANAESLRAGVEAGMLELRARAETAADLEHLKIEVSRRVDDIGTLLEHYREREQQLVQQADAAASALADQVAAMQQQAGSAEARIAEERRIALTDPLTRLPNREAWSRRLTEECERWRRYERSLSLAVCDIDRFKLVNDTLGHAGGDAVLAAVAAILRETLREADFVARYGGEEFVILLPETGPLDAAQALEHARREIAARPVRCADRSLQVTVSFGVAGFGPGDEAERVFARADAALYRAKHSGRDRVAVYSAEDASRA